MRLYDTARREIAEIEPINRHLSIYVCGITPYDAGHLGHAFIYHVFDLIAKRYRRQGITVTTVRNITDVDDDILRTARQRQRNWKDLAEENVMAFEQDMSALGLQPVDRLPRASQYIEAIVTWIDDLLTKGAAYANEGSVFFDTQHDRHFGELARLDETMMLQLLAERGGNPGDARKRRPLDFVLWQPSLGDEPSWPAPFGEGRPGWHIECSVMSTAEAGVPIDIHGGGGDLIYPHHESELAQARAMGIDPFVRYWVHVPYVLYDGEKMSKSLGNVVWIRDLISEYGAGPVRVMLNARHYRYSWEYIPAMMEQAVHRYRVYEDAAAGPGKVSEQSASEFRAAVDAALDDDLNTPAALEVLDALAISLTQSAISGVAGGGVSGAELFPALLTQLGIGGMSCT